MDPISRELDYPSYGYFIAVVTTTSAFRFSYIALRRLFKKRDPEYSSRLVAFFHGLVTAFFGINQCFYIDTPFYHPEWRTTYLQTLILVFSAGYFIHDLIWCLQYAREDKLMIVHHIYTVIFLIRILFKKVSGAQTTCGLGAMELTNPLLQARWFIRSEGLYPSLLFLTTETVFLMSYVFVRIILGTYVMSIIIKHPKNDTDFIISSIIIYVISWIFFINIIKYVVNKYFCGKMPKND